MPEAATTTWPAPRANPSLVGHARPRAVFARALAGGRLPHAWLLGGPQGVGKATFAWRVARWLLVHGGASGGMDLDGAFDLAPEHPTFRQIAVGGHPDIRAIERSVDEHGRTRATIVVEQVRPVAEFLALTPALGQYRVVIVDEAETMNVAAANAVLKWLEEPPDKTLIFLISNVPSRLPATIRSRCCRLAFAPLSADDTARALACIGSGDADTTALALLAAGRPGRIAALTAADGIALYGEAIGLLETLPELDWDRLHQLADKVAARHAEAAYRLLIEFVVDWIAGLARDAASGVRHDPVLPAESALADRLIQGASLARWTDVWEKIGGLAARAERINLDRKQVVLAVFGTVRGALVG